MVHSRQQGTSCRGTPPGIAAEADKRRSCGLCEDADQARNPQASGMTCAVHEGCISKIHQGQGLPCPTCSWMGWLTALRCKQETMPETRW